MPLRTETPCQPGYLGVDEAAVRNAQDLISVQLIDQTWRERVPAELASQLQALLDDRDG